MEVGSLKVTYHNVEQSLRTQFTGGDKPYIGCFGSDRHFFREFWKVIGNGETYFKTRDSESLSGHGYYSLGIRNRFIGINFKNIDTSPQFLFLNM